MIQAIRLANSKGDTLGGKFKVVAENVPIGLGSHTQWDLKLDGRLAQSLMSIQAVKAVEVGLGTKFASTLGSVSHDEIFYSNKKGFYRTTNRAGGTEGGMTNGEDIIITASMKPIPTMKTPLNTVDGADMSQSTAYFERSDTCAVEACSIVAEARIACVLANEILLKYNSDYIE